MAIFYSSIYGLTIQLNQQVPGIFIERSSDTLPDIQITFGSMPSWLEEEGGSKEILSVTPPEGQTGLPRLIRLNYPSRESFEVRYADGTRFLLNKDASEIWATWPSDTLTVEDTATYLLGPIMGFALLLRGCISLHASALAINGNAVAIVGPAGSGKSTTAAALAELGYSILAEDVVTLQDLGDQFLVQPAYPCIRLWPESVRALYGENVELPKLTPTWEKCYLDLTQEQYQFQKRPLPLAAIYLLGERSDDQFAPSIRELEPNDALLKLIANTYASRFMDRTMRGRAFEVLARLLKSVAVRRVEPHSDPKRIHSLCHAITSDFDKHTTFQPNPELRDQALHV